MDTWGHRLIDRGGTAPRIHTLPVVPMSQSNLLGAFSHEGAIHAAMSGMCGSAVTPDDNVDELGQGRPGRCHARQVVKLNAVGLGEGGHDD